METDDLFFQSLPNSVTFRLQDETFRVFFCIDKLVKALLQTTQCIFQREIQHGSRFYFTPPTDFPCEICKQNHSVSQLLPALLGPAKLPALPGSKPEIIHFTGGIGVASSAPAVMVFGNLVVVIHIILSCLVYIYYLILSSFCVVSFTLLVLSCTAHADPQPHKRAKRRVCG